MLHLTREMIDSFPNLAQKEKQQLYTIAGFVDMIVDTRLKMIDHYLRSTFSGEQIAICVTLEVLSDGKPRSWTEMKRGVNISTATLSKKLKMLTEQGVVKRKVASAFPPKTVYELDLKNQPELREYFLHLGDILKQKRELISRLIWSAVVSEVFKRTPWEKVIWSTRDIYKETLGHLFLTLIQKLDNHIALAPIEFHPSWIPLLTTFTSISIMQSFWTAQVALFSPKERAKESSQLLKARWKIERTKLSEKLLEEDLLQKIIPNLSSVSVENLKTLANQQAKEFLPKNLKILKYG